LHTQNPSLLWYYVGSFPPPYGHNLSFSERAICYQRSASKLSALSNQPPHPHVIAKGGSPVAISPFPLSHDTPLSS